MKAGQNIWICDYCGKDFRGEKDGSRPQHCIDERCPCIQFSAKYPHGRVIKGIYHYYTGRDEWTKDANAGMKLDAKSQMRKW